MKKRIMSLILVAIASLSLAACGEKEPEVAPEVGNPVVEVPAVPVTTTVNEEAEVSQQEGFVVNEMFRELIAGYGMEPLFYGDAIYLRADNEGDEEKFLEIAAECGFTYPNPWNEGEYNMLDMLDENSVENGAERSVATYGMVHLTKKGISFSVGCGHAPYSSNGVIIEPDIVRSLDGFTGTYEEAKAIAGCDAGLDMIGAKHNEVHVAWGAKGCEISMTFDSVSGVCTETIFTDYN